MKTGRPAKYLEYGWHECEADLALGVHPEVVAARIGEPVAFVLGVADDHGWPITWRGPTPDGIVDAFKWSDA
jgi:hypothetical protein